MKTKIVQSRFAALALVALITVQLAGCSWYDRLYKTELEAPEMETVMPEANPDLSDWTSTDGSLWPIERGGSLFADDKACFRGDIVLVTVSQETKGSSTASTDSTRSSSISATIKRLLGFEDQANNLTGYTNIATDGTVGDWDPDPMIEAESENSFSGEGTTERSDTLEATISAVVTDVLSNGNLHIYGSQRVSLNNESRVLTVQGIVRPSDIAIDNTIDSSRIADARIDFDGRGVVADKQRPGWGMRLFDNFWIF